VSESVKSPAGASLAERVQALRLPPPKRQERSAALPWTLCLLLAGGCAALGYREFVRSPVPAEADADAGKADKMPAGKPDTKPGTPSTAPAKAEEPDGKPDDIVLVVKGNLVAKQLILITPKVNGRIEKLFVEDGQAIKKDERIAILESDEYRFSYDRAVANLNTAKAKLEELEHGFLEEELETIAADTEEAQAQLRQAESNNARNQELGRQNNVPASEVEQAEMNYSMLKAKVRRLRNSDTSTRRRVPAKIASARADVQSAKAEVDRAKYQLDNCVVTSPITGTVLSKKAEEGNVVNPVAFAGSTSICEIADLANLEVDLKIGERDFQKVYDGQKCRIVAIAYPARTYDGVARRMPTADRSQGAVPVRVKVVIPPDEAGKYLRPEMGAEVSFLRGDASASK
jgi:multidrug resistance efflux pump